MKKIITTLTLLASLSSLVACGQSDNYTGNYKASGITVTIIDGGVNVTVASAILSNEQKILDVKMDSLLIPFYGMSATTKPERPAAIAILDPLTDDESDIYQFVRGAGEKVVLSKKLLGSKYALNRDAIAQDETLVYKNWARQVTSLEKYLVGKDYSSYLAKICRTSSATTYCTNELTQKKDVPNGAFLDFYGYDNQTGATITMFDNKYETLGASLIEMFNSNLQKIELDENSPITSSLDYSVTFDNNLLTVTFINTINEKDTIVDKVEIPLIPATNMLTFTNTRSYIKFDTTKKQVYAKVDNVAYDTDHVKSSYEK